MLAVLVVSDATGETAERMVQSALVQFENAPVELVRRGHVCTPEQVRAVVQEAVEGHAIILHTLVSDELRRLMLAESRTHNVDSLDMMGPVLDRFATRLKLTPQEKPGLFKQLAEAKSREIEAVDFAFRHDDGQRARELVNADIVLLGVSRTFKTPLSIYLAFKGWLVGNVPIISDLPPPESIYDLPPGKVFCLSTDANQLAMLRRARDAHLGGATGNYADVDYIRKELTYARSVFRKRRDWPVIEVTKKPIEEIASEILLRKRRFRKALNG